jgi:AsmA protein
MTRSRPMLLMVLTICLLIFALGAFWLAYLPQRLKADLAQQVSQDSGSSLQGQAPKLKFANGPELVIENVKLSASGAAGQDLTADQLVLKTGIASLLIGRLDGSEATLVRPIIDLEVGAAVAIPALKLSSISIRDGTIKLRDSRLKSLVAFDDVNGTIKNTSDGGIDISLSLPLGRDVTQFKADIENAQRLFADGSPADISISDPHGLVALSGRSLWSNGFSFDGQMNVETSQTASLLAKLALQSSVFERTGKMQLQAGVSAQGLSASFNKLQGKIGTADVSGDGRLEAGPDRTKLTGTYDVTFAQALPAPDISPFLQKPWRERPLDWADFVRAEIMSTVKLKGLKLGEAVFGDADLVINNSSGSANILLSSSAFSGGNIKAEFGLASTSTMPQLFLKADVKTVAAKSLALAFLGLNDVEGSVDLSTDLKTEGRSVASLISSLQGTLSASSNQLTFTGLNFDALLQKAGEGWRRGDASATAKSQFSFASVLRDGIVSLERASVSNGTESASPKGEVDLLRQAFDLKLNPKGKGTAAELSLRGNWMNPMFGGPLPEAPDLRPETDTGKSDAAVSPPAN